MYLIIVDGDVQSSNRMEYPTSSPRRHPTSSDTRLETDIAATRRGCVHAILPCTPGEPPVHSLVLAAGQMCCTPAACSGPPRGRRSKPSCRQPQQRPLRRALNANGGKTDEHTARRLKPFAEGACSAHQCGECCKRSAARQGAPWRSNLPRRGTA